MGYLDGPRPRLFAHRGASGDFPENTMEAFRAGLEAGADRLELDVHASADGTVMIFHDESLDRTTDGSGLLSEHTLAELKALDAGYRFKADDGTYPHRAAGIRVATLAEVLEALPGVALNIEIKQYEPSIEEAVLEVLDRFDARADVLLAAEDARVMERIRVAADDVITGSSALEVFEFVEHCGSGSFHGYAPRGRALQVPPSFQGMDVVTEAFVEGAHSLGLEVHVWTINDEAEMERLLDLDVDGLMTDYPRRAARVLEARGLR